MLQHLLIVHFYLQKNKNKKSCCKNKCNFILTYHLNIKHNKYCILLWTETIVNFYYFCITCLQLLDFIFLHQFRKKPVILWNIEFIPVVSLLKVLCYHANSEMKIVKYNLNFEWDIRTNIYIYCLDKLTVNNLNPMTNHRIVDSWSKIGIIFILKYIMYSE